MNSVEDLDVFKLPHQLALKTYSATKAFRKRIIQLGRPTRGSREITLRLDKPIYRRYKVFMRTLTITDAKKNLGRWLTAAARGEDIGIICGADIVALRKVNVESTDYAQREYSATPEQVTALENATEQRYRRMKRSKKLVLVGAQELRAMLE